MAPKAPKVVSFSEQTGSSRRTRQSQTIGAPSNMIHSPLENPIPDLANRKIATRDAVYINLDYFE